MGSRVGLVAVGYGLLFLPDAGSSNEARAPSRGPELRRKLTALRQKSGDSELMVVDSKEQSIVGGASGSERSEIVKVGSKGGGESDRED